MKMRYVLAALLMTGTAAHAGNSISFEINGHHVRIEAPKNCSELSCIQISAPGVSASDFGFKSIKTGSDDDDVVRPAPKSAATPAPVIQAAAPVAAPVASAPPAPATTLASTAPAPVANDIAPAAPVPRRQRTARARSCRRGTRTGSDHPARHLGDGREQGQCSRRTVRTESLRLRPQDRRENPHQHETVECKVDGPDSRSRLREELRLDRRDEGRRTRCGYRAAPSAACSAAARPGTGSADAACVCLSRHSGAPVGRTRNLKIPGSMLRIAPE